MRSASDRRICVSVLSGNWFVKLIRQNPIILLFVVIVVLRVVAVFLLRAEAVNWPPKLIGTKNGSGVAVDRTNATLQDPLSPYPTR